MSCPQTLEVSWLRQFPLPTIAQISAEVIFRAEATAIQYVQLELDLYDGDHLLKGYLALDASTGYLVLKIRTGSATWETLKTFSATTFIGAWSILYMRVDMATAKYLSLQYNNYRFHPTDSSLWSQTSTYAPAGQVRLNALSGIPIGGNAYFDNVAIMYEED